jgi:hypothetical protein
VACGLFSVLTDVAYLMAQARAARLKGGLFLYAAALLTTCSDEGGRGRGGP